MFIDNSTFSIKVNNLEFLYFFVQFIYNRKEYIYYNNSMFKYLFLYFILLLSILKADFNTTILDEYYDNLCQILVDSSNSVDDYFIDTNSTTQSKTEAELKTSFAIESGKKSEYAVRLRVRLNLPKLQKKFRLIFEDEDSDDIFYDGTSLNNQYKMEQKNYFLRLDFFNEVIKKIDLTTGIGVKFRNLSLSPYFNLKARYMLEDKNAVASNRFRLYSNGDYEDTLNLNKMKYFSSSVYFFYRNFFRYRSWTNNTSIVNSISATKILTEKKELTVGISLTSELEVLKSYIRYRQLYIAYRNLFYKDWVYYELAPSVLWREENNYEHSYRFMFNLGVKFKKY